MIKTIKISINQFIKLITAFGIVFLVVTCLSEKTLGQVGEQEKERWHGISRKANYRPDGEDFVIKNGKRRFNRALYGSNTAFRVEAGDLPEFALYLPGMGGNFKFGLLVGEERKWLIDAAEITARYRAGSMLYTIKDPILGKGEILVSVLPMYDAEGMLIKTAFIDVDEDVELLWAYGGISGKKFSRGGDLGADPESNFYLKEENCKGNNFALNENNSFKVKYNQGKNSLAGVFPVRAAVKVASAENLESPYALWNAEKSENNVIAGKLKGGLDEAQYFAIYNPETKTDISYASLTNLFDQAEKARLAIAGRITVKTPDPHINTIGGALAMAADAIWEAPSYLHGAVAWRMPLNGWRGAHAGDWLGWHERARSHFSSYAESQYTSPASGPSVPDPKTKLAREKEEIGTALFTSGYISRRPGGINKPHHYDMNMVFIDQLLRHFNWTGDTAYLKEIWPVIERHLAWETRNFDGDRDGLYSAYASIWASDALQYNGGGVAHSSAYNHLAFKTAARLAEIIGKDPKPYRDEAKKILNALNKQLWMSGKGWFGEFKDILGNKRLHSSPGLWSVYHIMDSEVPDPFQAYQLVRYVDTQIPHIPVIAEGMPQGDYHLLSTTNWMPYTWSVNNVAMAENMHTSLAYWQSGSSEKAFQLWKSTLLESLYLGGSPGNFQQLSFYDAMRGELYRDNGGPVGMTARTLVEGLFGILPDLLNNSLVLKPGFPEAWKYASIQIPDINFDYKQNANTDIYTITNDFEGLQQLDLQIPAEKDDIKKVLVNGNEVNWRSLEDAIGRPMVQIIAPVSEATKVEIEWAGRDLETASNKAFVATGAEFSATFDKASILEVFDPQQAITIKEQHKHQLAARVDAKEGNKTVFVKLAQGAMQWWEPLTFETGKVVEIHNDEVQLKDTLSFTLKNNAREAVTGKAIINPGKKEGEIKIDLAPGEVRSYSFSEIETLKLGNNVVQVIWPQGNISAQVTNWNIQPKVKRWEAIDLSTHFNDQVTNIFKNEYLTPRSPYPTPQIPIHGLGDWCSYSAYMEIDDSGLRKLVENDGTFALTLGLPFATPGTDNSKNVIFTSLWDNYPDSIAIPLSGKASHAYFLMAGSTNPMQSRFENGRVQVTYADGTVETLPLRNPETWWPIEQDYFLDGYAFAMDVPKPIRVHLKTGWIGTEHDQYVSIGNFTKYAVDGGAATVLDLPLDATKKLKELKLISSANDVVIGLMSLTLLRK